MSSENHVFAIGVGARIGEETFDIIGALKQIQNQSKQDEQNKEGNDTETVYQGPATTWHINMIFHILEAAGARTIRKWARAEDVSMALTDNMAVLLLNRFKSDKSFLKKFVQEFLPPACRDWSESAPQGLSLFDSLMDSVQSAYATVASSFKRATVEDIKEVVYQATPYLVDKKKEEVKPNVLEEKKGTVGVTVDSIFKVQDASDVLHGCVDEKELSEERCRDLLRSVEPFIYGATPLYQSIDKATELFQKTAYKFPSHRKLLFILSDGEPTDGQPTDRARIKRRKKLLRETWILRCQKINECIAES